MSILEMILLAIVQGITEFLPISSDGHLAVVNALLQAGGKGEVPDLLETTIVLHLGTLASVLIFYRKAIVATLTSQRRAILPLIAATIPAGVIGVGIEKGLPDETTKWLLESPLFAGFGFFITAAALWWLGHTKEGELDYPDTPMWKAVVIGFFQAAAILPGVSRSGLTISSGVGLGLKREAAATFSFLMAIPVIGGAGLRRFDVGRHRRSLGSAEDAPPRAAGAVRLLPGAARDCRHQLATPQVAAAQRAGGADPTSGSAGRRTSSAAPGRSARSSSCGSGGRARPL